MTAPATSNLNRVAGSPTTMRLDDPTRPPHELPDQTKTRRSSSGPFAFGGDEREREELPYAMLGLTDGCGPANDLASVPSIRASPRRPPVATTTMSANTARAA